MVVVRKTDLSRIILSLDAGVGEGYVVCEGLPAGNKQRTPLPAGRDGSLALEQLPSALGTIPGGAGTGVSMPEGD